MFGEVAPKLRGQNSPGMFPAGAIIDWMQADAYTPVPAGWALCNGQPAVWQTGPRAGQAFLTPNFIGMGSVGADVINGTSTANSSGYTKVAPGSVAGNANGSGSTGYGATAFIYTGTSGGYYFPQTYHTHAFTFQPPAISMTRIIKL